MVDFTRQINESGTDQVINNSRVRANVAATNAQGVLWMQGTGVATNFTTGSQTLTATILGGGLVVGSPSAAATYTLDTATNILSYMNANSAGISNGDIMSCLLTNAGSSTGVITVSPGTGGGFDTGQNNNLQLPINTSRTLNIKITNTSTPAYIVYG
jgi:hypothetical protein